MANLNYIQTAFSSGEVSPQIEGRIDIAKYSNSAATLNNVFVRVFGGAYRRPGTYAVAVTKLSTSAVRVIPFQFSNTQAYIIEAGDKYFRFYKDSGILMTTSTVAVEITTPYNAVNLFELQYAQDADTMYITHTGSTVKKLTRSSHYLWSLEKVDFKGGPWYEDNSDEGAYIRASGTSGAVTIYTSGNIAFVAGHSASLLRLGNSGGYVRITAVTNAGTASATVVTALQSSSATGFTDNWAMGAWNDVYGYPQAVSFFEQRLYFGGTKAQPQTVWGSCEQDYENFTPGTNDADAVSFTIADNQVNAIRWFAAGQSLAVGTLGGNFLMRSDTTSGPITPTSINIKKETAYGSDLIMPKRIGNAILYVQRNNLTIRELVYDFDTDSQLAKDATVLSEQITKSGVKDMDYQEAPDGVLWVVLKNGTMATLTRQADQDVLAWSRHDTQGSFLSVAVIPNGNEDQVWIATQRSCHYSATTTNGYINRIEYFKPFIQPDAQADSFYVDCGSTSEANVLDSNSKLLLHFDGIDEGVSIIDEKGKTITNTETYDSYTKLLVKFNGLDGSTDDYIAETLQTVSLEGTAQLNQGQKKFGVSSLLLNGSTDWVTLPDSADWDIGTNFTVDFWVRYADVTNSSCIVGSMDVGTDYWTLTINPRIGILSKTGNVLSGNFYSDILAWSINTWYHVAVVKNGSTVYMFRDGVSLAVTTSTAWGTLPTPSSKLTIGAGRVPGIEGSYHNGWIDEVRISKGIARWVNNFVPPVASYGKVATSTGYKSLGTASGFFDGGDSYITAPDSTDWDFGTGDFTIEKRIRFNSTTGSQVLIGQTDVDANNLWYFYKGGTDKLQFYARIGSVTLADYSMTTAWTALPTSSFSHVAVIRSSAVIKIYIDGVSQTLTETVAMGTGSITGLASTLCLGRYNVPGAISSYFNGWMDEVRVSSIARWTGNFTVVTDPYTIYVEPSATITGLGYLNSRIVTVLGDGVVYPDQLVTGGSITLTKACYKVHIGLKYTSTIKTSKLDVGSAESTSQGIIKRIYKAIVRLWRTLGCNIGNENIQDAVLFSGSILYTGDKEIAFPAGWNKEAQIYITQSNPLPLNVLAIISQVEVSAR
jgi:hypothetical protein